MGVFLLPLLVAGSVVAASPAAGRGRDGAVELEVLGVVPLESESASLLVLREKRGASMLPIFVGRGEAAAIDLRLKRAPSPRPLSADLLEQAIGALGGKVVRVDIRGVQAALFRARVTVQQGDKRVELEARPSDSVALAMAARAPIYASREVMDEAALSRGDLEKLKGPAGGRARAGDPPQVGPESSF
jgi:bifunctional DNase/RNase